MLVGRDRERVRAFFRAAFNRPASHRHEVRHQFVPVSRGGLQQAAHGREVVVDNVTEAPGAAGPGVGEVDLRRVLREAARRAAQILRGHVDRAREFRRGHLGEEAHRVTAERRGVLVPWPVVVVHRVRHDARLALALELQGHGAAKQRRLAPDERVLVRVDGIVVGRHEEARAVAAHLVHGEEDLRMPLAREEPRQRAVLSHVQHEGVAVDVVAHVLVVGPRHLPAFERRALHLLVPVGHQLVAVRVQRRHEDDDDPIEQLDGARVIRGGQFVQQIVCRLRGADFAGVDAAPDGDNRLRAAHHALPFAFVTQLPRVGEQPVAGLQRRQVLDVLRRADDGADDAAALGGGPDIDQFDAGRGGGNCFEVLRDRRPVSEPPVGAHLEPEERLGRRHLRG